MDPMAALAQLRAWAKLAADGTPCPLDETEAAELFAGLDDWITKGGHLPHAWAVGQRPNRGH